LHNTVLISLFVFQNIFVQAGSAVVEYPRQHTNYGNKQNQKTK
jgi:hypothetical protein